MKKAALALTTLAALTVATVALAQEPTEGGPTSTVPGATPPAPPAPQQQQQQQQQQPPGPGQPAPGPQGTPAAPPPPAPPAPPTSTTRITSADATAAPMPMAPPPTRETITLRQSYRPNRPLLYTGSTMLITSYAATAAVTATRNVRDANGDQSLYIPVAGPWLHLANTSHNLRDTILIAGSGVAQGAGVLIGALSLLVPEHVPAATIQAGGVKMNITATSYGRGSAGIGAVGQF